jgi:putative hydrolase of the HAD superfamily
MKAILFDLDGTLVDREASLEPFLRGQYDRCLLRSMGVDYTSFRDRYLALDGCGFTPRPQVYQTLITEYALDVITEALVLDFRTHIGGHSLLFPDTHEVLRQLRADGYKLGIITNGSMEAQSAKIHTCGLDSLIDSVLVSAQEGVKKPDAVIFQRAAERLSVEPVECVFVGDHPRLDVQGPQSVGMTTVWQRGCLPWPDDLTISPNYTIDRIAELLPIVYGSGSSAA